jgi:hypothetical protein
MEHSFLTQKLQKNKIIQHWNVELKTKTEGQDCSWDSKGI